MAWAASICPFGTACRPPRTISATYAAVNRMMATRTRVTRLGVSKPWGRKKPSRKAAMNSSVMSGTPRISSM